LSAENATLNIVEPADSGLKGIEKVEAQPTSEDVVKVINYAMSRLNDVIAASEKKLAQQNLGVEASVVFDDEDEEDWKSFLRFGKDGKEWRLFVGSSWMHDELEPKEWILLANTPRRTRANAIEALPKLYDELIEQAKVETLSLLEKVDKAEAFLAKLRSV